MTNEPRVFIKVKDKLQCAVVRAFVFSGDCVCQGRRMLVRTLLCLAVAMCLASTAASTSLAVYGDFHCHALVPSNESDPTIWAPEDAIEWHKQNGYNVMAVTNHMPDEYLPPSWFVRDPSFLMMPGREYSIKNVHFVLLFDPSTYADLWTNLETLVGPNPYDWCYDETQIRDVIRFWHSFGALVSLAHPHVRENPCPFQPTMQQWKDMGLDFVERISSGVWDVANQPDVDAAGLRVLAGSDGHGWMKTVPGGYTRMQVAEMTPAVVFEGLRNGTVWVEWTTTRMAWQYWLLLFAILGPVFFACSFVSLLLLWKKCKK